MSRQVVRDRVIGGGGDTVFSSAARQAVRLVLHLTFSPAPGEAALVAIHGRLAAVVVAGIARRRSLWSAAA